MPPSSTATVAAAHGSATAARARFGSTGISTSASVDPRWPRGQEPTAFDEEGLHPPQVLARKLTSGVLSVVFLGGCLILLIQVSLTLTAVPDWSADTKQAMIDLEQENILKLASDKAGYVDEVFGRVRGGLLQLRDFAGQVLLALPQTIVVEQYLMDYPGLEQSGTTWDHSGWFISGFDIGEVPVADSALEGLLNRSSLMDVPFRGMQDQHLLVYLASLEDPAPAAGEVSGVNMQMYAAFDMEEAGYLDFGEGQECDERATEYDDSNSPTTYDPRCRPWYQDAVEAGVIFTNPYSDAGTGQLTVTVAAPVFDSTDTTLLIGVVGMDVDLSDIEYSITDLNLIGDQGHAYLLAPGGEGEVAVHKDLLTDGGTQYITDLESGVDAEEFGAIVTRMSEECEGLETYSRDGSAWLLAWSHETVTGAGMVEDGFCGSGGFIAVVAVNEAVLLEAFSKLESEVPKIVALASILMALVVLAIGCVTGCIARSISVKITKPVNQLADVVHSLNHLDFSQQEAGTWMVNDVSCPELEELIKAFESMATVVKFANMSLQGGDLELARQNYVAALILFKKLGNDRGVNIVNNNLGNVFTLQAQELAEQAKAEKSKERSAKLRAQALVLYTDAETNYRLAIEDARMMCDSIKQRGGASSPLLKAAPDVEAGDASTPVCVDDDDLNADDAVFLQLANREFNLALCLAAKLGNNPAGCNDPNLAVMKNVRELILDCVQVTADAKDAKSSQRQLEFLLELSNIERSHGEQRAAKEAMDAAERVVIDYGAQVDEVGESLGVPPEGGSPPAPIGVLRQQLLAARGSLCFSEGNLEAASQYWANAIIDCGDQMDSRAVRSSLEGLSALVLSGYDGDRFSSELLVALSLPLGGKQDVESLTHAIDNALTRLQRLEASEGYRVPRTGGTVGKTAWKTNVDLCFVMDCTGSMQKWIDQAKDKLMDIIAQAKKDVVNLNLRVAFVGYRDFGDKKRYEGPFDFCGQDELPGLLAKLRKIRAYGGDDIPEDVAGGLKHAVELSWRSPIRLCILIADAPCHGTIYHNNIRDRYPKGCPVGLEPSKLMYALQYLLGVDFYFVSITRHTNTMISTLQNQLSALCRKKSAASRRAGCATGNTEPKFIVHDLGSNDNRFLETVVQSVKLSINLRVETY